MPTVVEHFDHLTEFGLKVIPLRMNSKVPIGKGWQTNWNWERHRECLKRFPDANIGVLLGDVIDVEGDSEHANRVLLELIGDYPHPSYCSTRSIHHLFKTPDDDLRLLKVDEIEFRGYGHQSVLPPSQHFGVEYRWLSNLVPVPEMPPRLRRFYDRVAGKKNEIKPGSLKVWCSICRAEVFLNEKRFRLELEAFRLFGSAWECQKCRTMDMRPLVRQLRSR